MSKSRSGSGRSSRRTFLKAAAGVAAGTVLTRHPLWAQSSLASASAFGGAGTASTKINPAFMITPQQAREWHLFKAQAGPTYAGSAGWKRFTDYRHLEDARVRRRRLRLRRNPLRPLHRRRLAGSAHAHPRLRRVAVEKLVTDGTPVPVVASYGMTSGSTPPEGITAPMLFTIPRDPPAAADIAGKILVFQTAAQPGPPYSNSFLDNYTLTDYEWRSPGKWAPLFTPPPTSVTNSYHCRWVWSQLKGFASIGIKARAAGIVVVYDLSPGAAFGLAQRSVYTQKGRAGLAPSTSTVRRSHSIA